MHRFFITKENINGDKVKITGSDFNHICYSLRLKKGDKFVINTEDDSKAYDRIVEILKITEDYLEAKIIENKENKNEPSLKITLAQAVPKKKNMELVVEKGTEIGIYDFIPVETKRTVVRLKNKKEKRRARWQRIAEAAAKQSGRGIIPEVRNVRPLEALEEICDGYDFILLPWEEEKKNNLRMIMNKDSEKKENINKVLIIIGPEGGLAEEEVELLKRNGAEVITLGPRILRTETAGLITSALVLYETGNMEGVE